VDDMNADFIYKVFLKMLFSMNTDTRIIKFSLKWQQNHVKKNE